MVGEENLAKALLMTIEHEISRRHAAYPSYLLPSAGVCISDDEDDAHYP